MQLLNKLFEVDGRLTRLEYLLFGVVPSTLIFLSFQFLNFIPDFWVILLILLPIIMWIMTVTTIKRGKDVGIDIFISFLLLFLVPIIFLFTYLEISNYFEYLFFLFPLYLLVVPTSKNKIKETSKKKLKLFKILMVVMLLMLLVKFVLPAGPCADRDNTQRSLTCIQLKNVSSTLNLFKKENGVYPTTQEGLEALLKNPDIKKYPNYSTKFYFKKLPKDSWGNRIIYRQKGDSFMLISYASDRKEGGEDWDKDILYPSCEKE